MLKVSQTSFVCFKTKWLFSSFQSSRGCAI